MSDHPLYRKWQDMKDRCYNTNSQKYPWYGAKGITVCFEWLSDPLAFIAWAEDNGWNGTQDIDKDTKIPGSLIYSPETCSLISHRENMIAVVGRSSGRKTARLKLSVDEHYDLMRRKESGETSADLALEYQISVTQINRLYRAFKNT